MNSGEESVESHFSVLDTQTVVLTSGWNTVSLYVEPVVKSIDSIFAGHDSILLAYEGTEIKYSRGEAISEGLEWNTNSGYVIYSLSPDTIRIAGDRIISADRQIAVRPGWNLLPYLKNYETACADAEFSGKVPFAIRASDGTMNCLAFNIFSLQTFSPGQAYWFYFDGDGIFTY
jgi:hypothetical protein